MDPVLEAFAAEGRILVEVVRGLTADDLGRPTNCPPWDLTELIVHLVGGVRVGEFRTAPPGARPREAADYYRRPERDTVEYRDSNVQQAQQATARLEGSAAEALDGSLRDAVASLTADDLDRVVEIPRVGPMRLREWLTTRVIALAAHGLDVAITLGRPPWTTPSAHAVMAPVFRSLLGRDWPAGPGWSEARVLALATGRAGLTDDERDLLGRHAARLPLLS
ncbi:maleylpyruvate isomerase N-terminal domain-containing protein [Microlunatus sp. GCM10028923]|uniref:maleylpyruvate isomerase N-terminal domain-containing protein n=1 Tax=Microlunatus sp. GCM10028923 TaxID=3273400 RepID=UPI00361F693C